MDKGAIHPRTLALFAALLLSSVATAGSEAPSGASCREEFAAVDDQADKDMQDINRLVSLLEAEIADPALSPSGPAFSDGLRVKLDAAKLRRSEIFDKQHHDLNAIRDRCDRLR